MPSNISHDRHRVAGWATTSEVHLASDMTRQLGGLWRSETVAERETVHTVVEGFWRAYHAAQTDPFKETLHGRLDGLDLTGAQYLSTEAATILRPGIAMELYPQFFDTGRSFVDKDGLVDLAYLLEATTELFPGVFHDRSRDLVLFAHPSFRRSQSRGNSLNAYVLRLFSETARAMPDLRARLRLDPDLIGDPGSARQPIELEYWRGPRFNDDISKIPSGVAEHKADERQRFYEGIDKTQIWWKSPEVRRSPDGGEQVYRTFEVEELVEHPSVGLGSNRYGCRYAHAEYDAAAGVISHFDGAIRAYEDGAYLTRIENAIDRAGKQADYTKLFRLDGPLPLATWKSLLTGFYRGNRLLPEYLGDDGSEPDNAGDSGVAGEDEGASTSAVQPSLAALVSFMAVKDPGRVGLIAEDHQDFGGTLVPFVEIGTGALSSWLKARYDLSDRFSVGFRSDVVNLSLIALGDVSAAVEPWADLVGGLADAIEAQPEVRRLSCSFSWHREGMQTRLSLIGDAPNLISALRGAAGIVDIGKSASDWIDELAALIEREASDSGAAIDWATTRIDVGRLGFPRYGELDLVIAGPPDLLKRFGEQAA